MLQLAARRRRQRVKRTLIAGSRWQARERLTGTLSDPISLVAAEIHHGLGAAGAHAGRLAISYSRRVPTQHKSQTVAKTMDWSCVHRMKWIGIHAASGSNGPKIKLRITEIKF
jgi:hypothetical protein